MGLFVQFGLQNRTIRTKKDAKNVHGAVGVVEAASSSLVTQTISNVHNRFQLWTLDIFFNINIETGNAAVDDFFKGNSPPMQNLHRRTRHN